MKMKKMTAIIALALCLSMLTAAGAEGNLKRGWEVVERKTFMFEQLPDEHYGPEAVVEYDAEHFAVFADPETGYWGVGLKAEYYPVNEDDTHTFENPAVIVLSDIGFDNYYRTNYDIRISIDRVTYASLPGSTVNADADVLGVFGYSRGMETVGFLSGWGCRVLAQDGEVWQVEDAAAYDTFGLCTEAEISVTAVSKDGRELKPGMLGGIKWTVADLDTLQPEGSAAGYDAHYFDETLKLVEGLVYSYAVQENHVLKTRGEERVNDCIAGKGELTGTEAGELAKRLASVIVSQDALTAKAIWRGCGNENTPARTELVFVGGPNDKAAKPAPTYTLSYVVVGSLHPYDEAVPGTVTDIPKGSNVTLASPLSTACKVADGSSNLPKESYYVNYLEVGTDKQLAPTKVVTGLTVGDIVTECAIDIDEYMLVSESEQDLLIQPSRMVRWSFAGWCSDGACTTTIYSVSDISADTTVYGEWVTEEFELWRNEITFYYWMRPILQ